VTSDSAEVLDEGSMARLIMLDLCTAFDVIDHLILLKHLEFSFVMKRISCLIILNFLQIKKYFARFLKPTGLNYPINNV